MKHRQVFVFIFHIIQNTFKVLFKKNKKIEKVELLYSYKSIFARGYFIIKFDFENVIWFQFKGITIKSRSGEIIFDIENLNQTQIVLIVQGFFRKKVYEIEVSPFLELKSENFKLQLHQVSNVSKRTNLFPIKLIDRLLELKKRGVEFKKNNPNLKQTDITVKLSSYNQNQFL